ncbi:hypothetical protein EGJ00_00540 [Pseudomonas saudiphocaensis]|nr:hypothetical protein EGJ00_00540 [Pseudomonas saudiphocaensis]
MGCVNQHSFHVVPSVSVASGNGVRHTRLSQSVSGASGGLVRHSSVQRCEASWAGVATTSPACCNTAAMLKGGGIRHR